MSTKIDFIDSDFKIWHSNQVEILKKNQSNRFDFMKSSSKLRKRPRDSVKNLCDRKNS